ncbi:hypothetical protein J3F83DRAFT_758090 [Trichoderma novae-zelandiae]
MEATPPQEQGQRLVGRVYPPQPLPSFLEGFGAGPERTKKRSRESSITVCDCSDQNHDLKRRQISNARDGATAAAAAGAATNGSATGMMMVNETVATSAEPGNAAAAENGSKEESTAAAAEETSTTEASCDGASTWDTVPTETSTLGASNGNPSTRQMDPRSASHGAAVLEATSREISVPEAHSETFADWQALLSRGRREPAISPDSEPDSDCYALPRSMWPREHKSDPFRDPSWQNDFNRFGTYMREDPHGLGPEATTLYKGLLEGAQAPPQNSLFDDNVIDETCERIRYRNETTLFRDITPLIAPSAELLALRDHQPHLGLLCESTNEVWSSSQPVIRIQSQPSYSVGFKAEAFTEEQFNKVTDFFEELCAEETSPMMGTPHMFFPCFSLEIGPMAIAERQNVHNMSVAMRGVVELFRGVCREAELHRQILGFSISHNHCQVEIAAHYPVIYGDLTNFYRRVIHSFDFSDPACGDRWAAYRFTRNLYDTWMPAHFDRICSAIADLPLEWPDGVDTIRDIQN